MKIIAFVIAMLVIVFCNDCTPPSQHDLNRYGSFTVSFVDSLDSIGAWRSDQLAEMRAELHSLDALGPSFFEVAEGQALVTVRPFVSPNCADGAARWTPSANLIEIDPACTAGYTELRAALGHEIGHALGMQHVCVHQGESSDCSMVGYGYAMMNPQLSYGDVFNDMGPNDIANDAPTELDLAEFRRTHP